MLALIRAIHEELKGAYGSPRMVKELRGRGFPASKERVERLMRENSIHARPERVKLVVASVMQPTVEYCDQPNVSL